MNPLLAWAMRYIKEFCRAGEDSRGYAALIWKGSDGVALAVLLSGNGSLLSPSCSRGTLPAAVLCVRLAAGSYLELLSELQASMQAYIITAAGSHHAKDRSILLSNTPTGA